MTVPYTRLTLSTSNSKTNEPHKYRLNLSNDLILDNSIISLAHCSIYYTWRNIKSIYNNHKFSYRHLASNITYTMTIPDGSYSIDDINQDNGDGTTGKSECCEDDGGDRDEGQRGTEDLVSGADPEELEPEMYRGGARGERGHVTTHDPAELLFEGPDVRAHRREPIALECLLDEPPLITPHMGS
mgnify:CR=1 FL=1